MEIAFSVTRTTVAIDFGLTCGGGWRYRIMARRGRIVVPGLAHRVVRSGYARGAAMGTREFVDGLERQTGSQLTLKHRGMMSGMAKKSIDLTEDVFG